jgi:uncharacterized membrane protein
MWWRISLNFIVIIIVSYLLFNLIAYILPDSPTAIGVILLVITIQISFIISIQIYMLQKERNRGDCEGLYLNKTGARV